MVRRERLLLANPLCAMCLERGITTAAMEVDHIIPLHQGGPDIDSNTQNLCHACHSVKTARDLGKRARPRIGLDGVPIGPHHWNT